MTNQEQQKNGQPQIIKESEQAFAPSPRIDRREEDTKEKPEIGEKPTAPEQDIDRVNN
jgi:hypothetical protein